MEKSCTAIWDEIFSFNFIVLQVKILTQLCTVPLSIYSCAALACFGQHPTPLSAGLFKAEAMKPAKVDLTSMKVADLN